MTIKQQLAGIVMGSKVDQLTEPTEAEYGYFCMWNMWFRFDVQDGTVKMLVPFSDRLSTAQNILRPGKESKMPF